eukprot:TRINITY_DN3921_c0_g1_i1.p1 TRINITY_DN3921_c0_g1~~TRINITY_DN3921_c0_g1_i1.p1  ORF type:complete len:593 (-),score=125.25 TRINITY_DN3921_c0_g1_i1:72-1850(-)
MTTWSNQDILPSLPVPPLQQSVDLYLASLLAYVPDLISEQEYEHTKRVCQEFVENEGTVLQAKLEQKGKESRNWLEPYWLTYAYHIWREPLPVNANYFGAIFPESLEQNVSQCRQAANILTCFLRYKELWNQEMIPPQYMKKGTIPLDMDSFRYAWTTLRFPGETCDYIEYVQCSSECVVVSNGHFYVFDVYHEDGTIITTHSMELQYEWILEDSKKHAPEPFVGALTTEDRSVWAKYFNILMEDPQNAQNVKSIKHCLNFMQMDEREPKDNDELAYISACDYQGRWYDKICQTIAFKNGKVGCNGEHSPADAPFVALILDYAGEQITNGLIDHEARDTKPLKRPVRLEWNLNEELVQAIDEAIVHHEVNANDLDLVVMHYKGYGRKFIKQNKFSPDSYMQMALQLAYKTLHGHGCATYETAHTRRFFHGRTETLRSFSKESREFTEAMLDPSVSNQEKLDKLRAAIAGHRDYLAKCTSGNGCDRHLLGLRILQMELGQNPSAIFTDPSYSKSTTYLLSTSQMPAEHYYPGFGPTAGDGYGCCYSVIKPDELYSMVTSRHSGPTSSSAAFRDAIYDALDRMHDIVEAVNSKM